LDVGEINAAMGGFFFGQMFAGQTQTKPALLHFVCIKVDKKDDLFDALEETLKEVFLDVPQETKLGFDFTNKGELKVWRENKGIMEQPLFTVGLCTNAWTKKDFMLILGLRNEVGAPIPLNLALLRHILKSLDAKKVKYEIW
jgi:hypothetical protein